MLSPLLTPDTGLGSTGTALVSSYGGVPVAAGPGVIASLSPAPIPSGDLWTALDVRGSGFVQGEAVESPQLEVQDTTVHSDSWITAHVRGLGGYSGPGELWLTAPNGAQSNAVSILIAAPTSGGGVPFTVIGEPVTLPPIVAQPIPPALSAPGTIAPPTTTDVLNVDRQGSAPASSTPPGAPGGSPAPSPELKLSAQPAAPTGAGSAPSSTAAAPAAGGSSFPWWLLLLAFLFGKAT